MLLSRQGVLSQALLLAGWCLLCTWWLSVALFLAADHLRGAHRLSPTVCSQLQQRLAELGYTTPTNIDCSQPLLQQVRAAMYRASMTVMLTLQLVFVFLWLIDVSLQLVAMCTRRFNSTISPTPQLKGHSTSASKPGVLAHLVNVLTGTTPAGDLTAAAAHCGGKTCHINTSPQQPLIDTTHKGAVPPKQQRGLQREQQQLCQAGTAPHDQVCLVVMTPGAESTCDAAAGGGGAAAAGGGVVDVWVMAGQSNCVGWNAADGQAMPAAAAPWEKKILKFDRQGGCWQTAVPNIHVGVYGYADTDSCGPDMAFARGLIHTGAAHKVGLVPTACGGTNLYAQWAPGGELWSNMVADTAAALDLLGHRGRLAGIIWIQGESDAFTQEAAAAYGKHFTAWLSATRCALQAYSPCVPVVLAVMATRQRQQAFPFIDTVAEQQRRLKLPQVLKVDMAGYEFYDGGDGSLVHLSKAGCCALGTAMAYEVSAWKRGGCSQ